MSQVVHNFTVSVPHWSPYIKPVELESASQEQLDAMKVTPSSKKISAIRRGPPSARLRKFMTISAY